MSDNESDKPVKVVKPKIETPKQEAALANLTPAQL